MHAFPPKQGLYDGASEHDACGVAMVARLDNLGKGASGAAVQAPNRLPVLRQPGAERSLLLWSRHS